MVIRSFDAVAEKIINDLSGVTPLEDQLYYKGILTSNAQDHCIIYGAIGTALSKVDEPVKFKVWFDAIVAIRATRDELDTVEAAYPQMSDDVRASQRLNEGALSELQKLAYDSVFALILRKLPKPVPL